jgi:hypothetical protein
MKQNFIILILFIFPALLLGQNNEVSVLVENEVDTILTYKREIKRNGKLKRNRILIEVQVLNSNGLPFLNQVYRKNKVSWERHFEYYEDNSVKTTIDIEDNDTTVTFWEREEYIFIITGGIPDYFPEIEYYPNGLMKSETRLGSNREYILEYEYKVN